MFDNPLGDDPGDPIPYPVDQPCRGHSDLFFATTHDLKHPDESGEYAEAVAMCRSCPQRQPCAQQGVAFFDRHTVRAGLRLWIHRERAKLLSIAKGDTP